MKVKKFENFDIDWDDWDEIQNEDVYILYRYKQTNDFYLIKDSNDDIIIYKNEVY